MLDLTTYALFGLSLLVLIFIFLTIINIRKLNKISQHSKNGNIALAIETYYNKVDALTKNIGVMSERFTAYEHENKLAFKKIGIVQFNAFGDISGNLSFSIAIINDNNDGFIMTSLYGHENSSVYFRDVKNGTAKIHISSEEQTALQKAMNN